MHKKIVSIAAAIKVLITLTFALVLWRGITDKSHGGDVLVQFELRTSQDNVFKLLVNGRAQGKPVCGKPDFQKLTYVIPREEIHDLRLVLGDKPAMVTIRSLIFRNFSRQQRWEADQLRQLISSMGGIVSWNLGAGGAEIISLGNDAHVVFIKKMLRHIHFLQFDPFLSMLITVFLSLLLLFLLLASDLLQPWRTLRGRPVSPLAIIFFLVLFLPLIDGLLNFSRRWPLHENRILAPAPVYHFDNFWGFPELFQQYHADHFGMRNVLVRLYQQLRLNIFHISSNPSVLLGKKGWLFLAKEEEDGRNIIDYHRGLQLFSTVELDYWLQVFRGRRDWLRQRGIGYLIVWAPDKTSIYPEFLPSAVHRVRAVTRLDQLLAHGGSLPLLDLRPPLLEAKKQAQVFLRTDTHWNDFGGYVAYRAIIDRLRSNFPGMVPITLSNLIFTRKMIRGGDLARMLTMADSLPEMREMISFRQSKKTGDISLPIPPNPWITWSATEIQGSSLPRAVMFRDSFAQVVMGFLSEHFSRIFYMYDRQKRFDTDLIVRENPDVVIEEIAERFLLGFMPENPDLLSASAVRNKTK